jgi:hypothetical protein
MKEREKTEEDEGKIAEHPSKRAETNKSTTVKTTSSSLSSADTTSLLNNMPQRHPPPASASERKPHSSCLTSNITIKDVNSSSSTASQSSPSLLSSSMSSSIQLPAGCLCEHDGCDQAELLARAKRCLEIIRLSQQAKEAEAARARSANIKPLLCAKPTFELDSNTPDAAEVSDTTALDETKAASLGKRKEREGDQHPYQLGGLFHSPYPKEKPTPEEIQTFVDFTNKWIPSAKGKCTESEAKEEKADETKGGDAS